MTAGDWVAHLVVFGGVAFVLWIIWALIEQGRGQVRTLAALKAEGFNIDHRVGGGTFAVFDDSCARWRSSAEQRCIAIPTLRSTPGHMNTLPETACISETNLWSLCSTQSIRGMKFRSLRMKPSCGLPRCALFWLNKSLCLIGIVSVSNVPSYSV